MFKSREICVIAKQTERLMYSNPVLWWVDMANCEPVFDVCADRRTQRCVVRGGRQTALKSVVRCSMGVYVVRARNQMSFPSRAAF